MTRRPSKRDTRAGTRFHEWTLIKRIDKGRGGQGLVWKAQNVAGVLGALKMLRSPTGSRPNKRFRDEVEAMRALGNIPGVLPILDAYLPDRPKEDDPAWLVSALATPLEDTVPAVVVLRDVVEMCCVLAGTLSDMHARGFAHRDVKPGNVFKYGGRWCLGDFGLVQFPGKAGVTQPGEKLGPTFYIAPEMLNEALNADGARADVYSLAKLLWKLVSGQKYPLPGPQDRRTPALTLSRWTSDAGALSLDALLEAMTAHDPKDRPSMSAVASALAAWLAPPPEPAGPLDLAPLKRQIEELTGPRLRSLETQRARRGKVEGELQRICDDLFPLLKSVRDQLADNNIGHPSLQPPNWLSGQMNLPLLAQRNDAEVIDYRLTVQTRIAGSNDMVEFVGGFCLRVQMRNREEDLRQPVCLAAGFSLATYLAVDNGQRVEAGLPWADQGEFLVGFPEEEAVLGRLTKGFAEQLRPALARALSLLSAVSG